VISADWKTTKDAKPGVAVLDEALKMGQLRSLLGNRMRTALTMLGSSSARLGGCADGDRQRRKSRRPGAIQAMGTTC